MPSPQPERQVSYEDILRLQGRVLNNIFQDETAILNWISADEEHGTVLKEVVTQYLKTHDQVDLTELTEELCEQSPTLKQLH